MLKPQKSKFKKKDLKKDPLLDSVLKAQTFYEDNKNTITYSIVGVIIVVLLIVWIHAMQNEEEEQAVTLLGKAQVEYDSQNFTKARAFLTKLRATLGGTDAELQGTFLLANLDFNDGKYAEAKDLFNEFVDSYSGSEILISSAYAGIAACEEQDKNFVSAAENYKTAYSKAQEFPQAAEYLYLAGLDYLSAGDSSKAKETFQKVLDEYPDSPKKFDVQTELLFASNQ